MNFMKKTVMATLAACVTLVSTTSNAQNLMVSSNQNSYYFPATTTAQPSVNTISFSQSVTPTPTASPAIVITNASFNNPAFTNTVYNPTASTAMSQNVSPTVQGLIAKAKTLIGLPYRWGGTSPVSGFDCSGFMQYIYKHTANLNLPRRSQDMALVGQRVSRDSLKAGDMVFFKTHGSAISHVGMYIGENRFIHAPRTGKSIEITNLNSNYYTKTFVTARRVLTENNA